MRCAAGWATTPDYLLRELLVLLSTVVRVVGHVAVLAPAVVPVMMVMMVMVMVAPAVQRVMIVVVILIGEHKVVVRLARRARPRHGSTGVDDDCQTHFV